MSKEDKRFFRWLFVIILLALNYMLINVNSESVSCTEAYGYPVYFMRRNISPDGCLPTSTAPPYTNSFNFNIPGLVIDFATWILLSFVAVEAIDRAKSRGKQ